MKVYILTVMDYLNYTYIIGVYATEHLALQEAKNYKYNENYEKVSINSFDIQD